MICKHKFLKDLTLKNLDFKPIVLIVGTFNPEWPDANYAKWFYGRKDSNYFWEVLPRLFNEKSLLAEEDPKVWKKFCSKHKIALTDLISEIKNVSKTNNSDKKLMASYSDEVLISRNEDIIPTNIKNILRENPSIKNIYFTRSLTKDWIKIWRKCGIEDVNCITQLFTPSRYASYATSKARHASNFDKPISIPDFILDKWKTVFKNESNHKVK